MPNWYANTSISGMLSHKLGNAWSMRAHKHPFIECNLVSKGHMRYLLDDRRYELSPGSIVWLLPGQTHFATDWSTDLELWVLSARRRVIDEVFTKGEASILRRQRSPDRLCRKLAPAKSSSLRTLLQTIHAEQDRAGCEAGLRYGLASLWTAYAKSDQDQTKPDLHPSINKLMTLLSRGDTSGLADLAAALKISPKHLSHLCRQETGQTVTDLRNRLRLERWFGLLPDRAQRSLLHLALDAGFGSYAQFHRVFTNLMGQSPQQWLKQQEEISGKE